ncbi:Receptor tyrosine-protein kinase erbB-2 [Mactra antiquata]
MKLGIFGFILAVSCLETIAAIGEFGSTCTVNSDCQLGFVCQSNKCGCDKSHIYNFKGTCKKICQGTNEGLVKIGNSTNQYKRYLNRYRNCTFVDGNLEITSLEADFDLGFLNTIEEVEGYVLIVDVFSNYLNLTSLRIIRGNQLFRDKQNDTYSLYVALNHDPTNNTRGLLELQLTNLSEIMNGKVYFHNNNLLCLESTINWADINPRATPPVIFISNSENSLYRRQCPNCHQSCWNAATSEYNCWGSGPNMCQKLNHVTCHPSCDGRCFGTQQNQCCHSECAAGCDGPLKTECYACKNFYNDGECHPYCPQMQRYDQTQMRLVPNPDGRYSFGSLCVVDCPSYLVKDGYACVLKCPEGKAANKTTNECEDCDGPCPKVCPGTPDGGFLDSENIHNFKDCTIVDGNLMILRVTFDGDPHANKTGLKVSDLQMLKDIEEISGFLTIQEVPLEIKNLSFLSSLETIYGRMLSLDKFALSVFRLNIEWLGLTSLKKVWNGDIVIAWNVNICYVQDLDLSRIFEMPTQLLKLRDNKSGNRCEAENKTCDHQCTDHGCWGPGPDKCLQCKAVRVEHNNTCLGSCADLPMLFNFGDNTCKKCHEQCAVGCHGPGPGDCFECKHVKVLGLNNTSECMPYCPLPLTPPWLYPDKDKICRLCHSSCDEGCTGPSDAVKVGGCNTCELAINRTQEVEPVRCLPLDTEFCPRGYYEQHFRSDVKHPLTKKRVCQPCNHLCLACYGQGIANCPECRYFRRVQNGFSSCLEKCPLDTYNLDGECETCHHQCKQGCYGPNATNCDSCLNFKIFLDKENPDYFECVESCPDEKRHLVADADPDKPNINVCADDDHPEVIAKMRERKEEERKKILSIALPICGGVLALGILLCLTGYYWRQRERAKENTIKLTAKMTGVVDTEPLTPTDAKPDLSKLRLIRESELRRGGIIGSGAFGTVYKGFWIPDGENVKIPVAIKVLQEGTSPNQNQELLEEARVMTSVDHPCCIRILAVCMASQMMLITQLMPLGCLLDYIRKHKDNTGSKSLLNWCTQIARGMGYLEERGIVHRDLAARNVLVQSAGQVKITDFGLAKLLDYNEEEYHASGGKMPIKWLALECIQNRIFTHKSDVWSYGVTVWELFMYGARPYENVRAREIPDLLEKGERLPQPPICTIDVYMIMIKCWMLDADSRPSFAELAEEFAKMSRDPGRYLVIAGDKLMRLPSYSYDKDDLARHLSVAAEGPEEVIEADEYLQPAPPIPLESLDNNNVKTPLLSTSPGACGREPQLIREKRYGHLESAAAARQQRELSPSNRLRGDSINGRYSSDPVKYTRSRDEVDAGMMYRGGPSGPSIMGNGNIPNTTRYYGDDRSPLKRSPGDQQNHTYDKWPQPAMQLPLDEDDYLQPKSANPKAYLDLESKDYYLNEKQMEGVPTSPSDYLVPNPVVPSMFENPEYFEGDPRDNVFKKPNNNDVRSNSVKPKIAPKPKRTDYYNDVNDIGSKDIKSPGPKSPNEVRPLLSSNCSNDESAV